MVSADVGARVVVRTLLPEADFPGLIVGESRDRYHGAPLWVVRDDVSGREYTERQDCPGLGVVQEWEAGGWHYEGVPGGYHLRWFVSHEGAEVCRRCGHENLCTGSAVYADLYSGGNVPRRLGGGWFCCLDCVYEYEREVLGCLARSARDRSFMSV